jgi:hypothetical protein
LHHWEGLQNFFLLLADFSELSLFPLDLICHCVPSSFLYIVVIFSAICEICIPVVTVVSTVLMKWTLWPAEKENTEALLVTSKGVGAEVNIGTTKCMLVSCEQNWGWHGNIT